MTQQIERCPNPECHSGTIAVISNDRVPAFVSVCCSCGYQGPHAWKDDETAIALHNRIARAVREASELSHLAGHYLARSEQAEAERDALRALIEQNNRRCEIGCKRVQDWVNCGIAECGRCPRRYIIELPTEPAKVT